MAMIYDDTREVCFEDLSVGDESLSASRTVTEADLVNFAALIGWYDPLHCDSVYAGKSIFKKRVAPGLLGLALSNGLCRGCIATGAGRAAVLAFADVQWSFKKPIFIGDTIHVRQVISDKKESGKADRGLVVLDVSVVNQHGTVVQEGRKTFVLRRRG